MTSKDKYAPPTTSLENVSPFESVEDAWFWFISAQQAKIDGARITARQGHIIRPCEPVDILRILDRLYRNRRLLRDHLLVLRHYGRRQMPPDVRRTKEIRSARLWAEAMERLRPVLESKGIVRPNAEPEMREYESHTQWIEDIIIYNGGQSA